MRLLRKVEASALQINRNNAGQQCVDICAVDCINQQGIAADLTSVSSCVRALLMYAITRGRKGSMAPAAKLGNSCWAIKLLSWLRTAASGSSILSASFSSKGPACADQLCELVSKQVFCL